MAERDLNQPIVIDQGSGTLKAGFAGSDHPTTYFPSYVGEFDPLLHLLYYCVARRCGLALTQEG